MKTIPRRLARLLSSEFQTLEDQYLVSLKKAWSGYAILVGILSLLSWFVQEPGVSWICLAFACIAGLVILREKGNDFGHDGETILWWRQVKVRAHKSFLRLPETKVLYQQCLDDLVGVRQDPRFEDYYALESREFKKLKQGFETFVRENLQPPPRRLECMRSLSV
jgi:hypothetical protein